MYAVVKTSGRQYRIAAGESFSVEKLVGAPGSTIEIKEVLMIGGDKPLLGAPYVTGATVTCVVEQQYRGTKILVFKKKRRHKYRNQRGHRSELTRLFVSEIASPSGTVKAEGKAHVLAENREKKVAVKKAKTGEDTGLTAKAAKKATPAAKKKTAAYKAAKKPAPKKAASTKAKK